MSKDNTLIAVTTTGIIILSTMLTASLYECDKLVEYTNQQAEVIRHQDDEIADANYVMDRMVKLQNETASKLDKSKGANKKLRGESEALKSDKAKMERQVEVLQQQVKSLRAKQSKESASTKVSNSNGWNKVQGQITAYSPHDNRSGQEAEGNGNVTSIGVAPGYGRFAVDPRRIPYGSKIKIVYADGRVEHGIAADTGGALRNASGIVIDVYRDTYEQATNFGRRAATIYWQ